MASDYSIEVAIPSVGPLVASTGNDIEVTTATKGLVLRDSNGTRYRLTVDTNGVLTTTAL